MLPHSMATDRGSIGATGNGKGTGVAAELALSTPWSGSLVFKPSSLLRSLGKGRL